jgi:riboflavin synthase
MFSWIIRNKAKILEINNWNYTLENIFKKDLNIWISIAHDWACMTVIKSSPEKYSFFVMEESIKKTNFKNKKVWDYFNIEWSLKMSDTMDGHFVSWHVDTTWKVTKIIKNDDGSKYYYINFSEKYKNLIIEKWSITINWVSLTIVEDWNDYLSVSIIPLTQEITNIWDLEVWDIVNLEFDILGKYINKIQGWK